MYGIIIDIFFDVSLSACLPATVHPNLEMWHLVRLVFPVFVYKKAPKNYFATSNDWESQRRGPHGLYVILLFSFLFLKIIYYPKCEVWLLVAISSHNTLFDNVEH